MLRAGSVRSAGGPVSDGGVRDAGHLPAPDGFDGGRGGFPGRAEALAGGVVALVGDDALGAGTIGLVVGAVLAAAVEGVREVCLAQAGGEADVIVDAVAFINVTAVIVVETLWK